MQKILRRGGKNTQKNNCYQALISDIFYVLAYLLLKKIVAVKEGKCPVIPVKLCPSSTGLCIQPQISDSMVRGI